MTAAGQTINDRLVLKQVLEGARDVQPANHHIGRTEGNTDIRTDKGRSCYIIQL